MSTFISKKEAEKLMNIEGEVRGLGIKDYFSYIEKKIGRETVEKVKQEIRALGYDFQVDKIANLGFYPVGFEALTLVAIHKILGFDKEEIRKMGGYQAKSSIIMKFFMKYFVSVDKLAEEAPKMWRKYYTEGKLSVPELSIEKREGVIILEGFKLHSLHCRVLEGYFATVLSITFREEVNCLETKCPFQGDPVHKFSLSW